MEEEFPRRNEKVKLAIVVFQADAYRTGRHRADSEVSASFEKNKEKYRIRRAAQDSLSHHRTQACGPASRPAAQDVERAYNATSSSPRTPSRCTRSHILLKTESKDEAAVRKQAEAVLKEVKAGGDFAALATKYSEDEQSKARAAISTTSGAAAW